MVQSVLGSLLLGYRPLWNRERRLAGVQLYVHPRDPAAAVDAPHLLRTLAGLWSASSPPLLLSPQTPQLLCDLLAEAPRGAPWIEVRGDWLGQSTVFERVRAAHQRGLKLVWRGPLDRLPDSQIAACFDNSLLSLSAQDAIATLRSSPPKPGQRAAASAAAATPARPVSSPLLGGQVYEGIASRALMQQCLDQAGALALAGWPDEDVLYTMRLKPQQPAHEVIARFLKAIDEEQSLEAFEAILGQDPLLAYRFMVYTNSAALGLRTGIDSLRRGLVMMGYGSIGRWLGDQLPHSHEEPDLRPVREGMCLRARLMAQLIDAGIETELRSEIYLCGLFSRLDELLAEPLGTILRRIPLPERVYDAIVLHTGPYAPTYDMACALETPDAAPIRQLCEQHQMNVEEVNRALLRVLADLEVVRKGTGATPPDR